MEALTANLWRWTTPHPHWRPEMSGPGGWDQEVGSVAYQGSNGVVLIDPLVGDDWSAVDALVGQGPVAVVLTAPWHERSSAEVAERYGATAFVHHAGRRRVSCRSFRSMDEGVILPGVEVLPVAGADDGEVVLWLVTERALIAAEVLTGTDAGLRVAESPSLRSPGELVGHTLGVAGHVQRAAAAVAQQGVRLVRARPASEWWAEQRERILNADLIDPVKVMFSESMRLEPAWAAEFRGFWDLPEDFDFDVVCPTVPVERAAPGKVTPEESAAAFLKDSEVFLPTDGEEEIPVTTRMTEDQLGELLDEQLSRRTVHDIQSGIKDPDRFDKWVALLQERVAYDDPIVLPYGEGLNIVKRSSDGEMVIRTDAGADLCRWDENWKMHTVMFVRDTDELYREVYPELGHPSGDWQELREYYCPESGHLLDVEAYPPGYPVVHEYLPNIEGFYQGWLGREVP